MPNLPFHVEVSTDALKSVETVIEQGPEKLMAESPVPNFADVVNKAIEKGKEDERDTGNGNDH